MKIYQEDLWDVSRYLEQHRGSPLERYENQFTGYVRPVEAVKKIDASTRMLEIGVGTGWFPIMCKLRGWQCKGLEISPQLIEYAKEWGCSVGAEPDIELGNIEETKLPDNHYDVIICSNVFEHVEDWRLGVRRVHAALKPGGVMFFESTSKFSFTSGEYHFPLYGWYPNGARYFLRKKLQHPDIMKLGIDFHQFRHSGLRREFQKAGFRKILDRVDMAQEDLVSSELRRKVVRISKAVPLVKAVSLAFSDATRFLCVK